MTKLTRPLQLRRVCSRAALVLGATSADGFVPLGFTFDGPPVVKLGLASLAMLFATAVALDALGSARRETAPA